MAQRVTKRLAETKRINGKFRLYRYPDARKYGGIESRSIIFSAFCEVYGIMTHARRLFTRFQNSAEERSFPGFSAALSPISDRYLSSSSSNQARIACAAREARDTPARFARARNSPAISGVSVTRIRSLVVAIYQKCITSVLMRKVGKRSSACTILVV